MFSHLESGLNFRDPDLRKVHSRSIPSSNIRCIQHTYIRQADNRKAHGHTHNIILMPIKPHLAFRVIYDIKILLGKTAPMSVTVYIGCWLCGCLCGNVEYMKCNGMDIYTSQLTARPQCPGTWLEALFHYQGKSLDFLLICRTAGLLLGLETCELLKRLQSICVVSNDGKKKTFVS